MAAERPLSAPVGAARAAGGAAGDAAATQQRRIDGFIERQFENPDRKYELRRHYAKLQRDIAVETRKDSDCMLWGAQGTVGFRKLLSVRFGSLACAWRAGLDRDGNGKISFGELRQSCHELAYNGKLQALWLELDKDQSGFISLNELDPEAHKGLKEFRQFISERFGSSLAAWECLSKGARTVSERAFVDRTKAEGFTGDSRRVFRWLRTDVTRKELTLQDLDPQAYGALLRADPCAESIGCGESRRLLSSPKPKAPLSPLRRGRLSNPASLAGSIAESASCPTLAATGASDLLASACVSTSCSPTFRSSRAARRQPRAPSPAGLSGSVQSSSGGLIRSLDHASRTRNSEWFHDLSQAQIEDLKAARDEHMEKDKGMKTLEDLRFRFAQRFGSTLAGWRLAIDPVGKGRIAYVEFCDRIRDLGYNGDVRELFKLLDEDCDGFVRLKDVDPQADALLSEFRSKLCAMHGNMLTAWTAAFDPLGGGFVEKETFVKQCAAAGIGGDVEQLFRNLQDFGDQGDKERKFMTLREFDFSAFSAFGREDHEMMTESHSIEGKPKPCPLGRTFEERQEATFAAKWHRLQCTKALVNHRTVVEEAQRQDVGCRELATLKGLLLRKFGSISAAWKDALDPLCQGQLSFEEFCRAVRLRVGFRGDLRELWCTVAKSRAFITLHDLDADSAELLWTFRAWLLQKFDSLVLAWQGLDPRRAGRLEEANFCDQCKVLGFEGDAHQLFTLLRSAPHKRYVTLSDLDPSAAQALYRGDHKALTMHGNKTGATASPRSWPGRSAEQQAFDAQLPSQVPGFCHRGLVKHTRITQWSRELGRRYRHNIAESSEEQIQKCMAATSLGDFRRMLVGRFRTVVAAWRVAFDPEGLNRLTFSQFCLAIERMGGQTGNVKQLWAALDAKRKGFFSLEALDADADKALTDFREALVGKYGNLHDAWHKGMALERNDRLDQGTFITNCRDFLDGTWTPKRLHRTFRLLLPEPLSGRHHMQPEDLEVLLLNIFPADRNRYRAPAVGVAQPPRPAPESQAAISGDEGTSTVAPVEAKAPSPRCFPRANANELPGFTPEDFNKLLKSNFGSIYAAWVRFLDITELGRVPEREFAQRAKEVGIAGNVHKLYHAIDTDNKGHVSLSDLSAEVAESTASFLTLAEAQYGCLARCWAAFDAKKKGYVNKEDFVSGCKVLGYPSDAARLFNLFRPEPGRTTLYLEDLGPKGAAELRERRGIQGSGRRGHSAASSPRAGSGPPGQSAKQKGRHPSPLDVMTNRSLVSTRPSSRDVSTRPTSREFSTRPASRELSTRPASRELSTRPASREVSSRPGSSSSAP